MDSKIRALKTTTKNLQEKADQLTQTVLTNTSERVKAKMKMDKNDMNEPVPGHLPIEHPYVQPTPFLGRLKGQKDNLYKIREGVCMIRIPEMIHKEKNQVDNGCDITVKDIEWLRQMLTPTIHTLPNHKLVVQPYMPLNPFRDKAIIAREEEWDNDIPLQDGVMKPLTPQTAHITPPDDVAPATSPILDKHLDEFGEEFFDITRVAEKADNDHVSDVNEFSNIIKTYDFETFIRKLLHQVSQSSHEIGSRRRKSQITLTRNRRGRIIVADAAIMTDFKGNEVAQEALDGNSSHIIII
ncbi:hypothetical protein Tco_1244667 [Tanacetum coccineum]